MHSPHGLCNPKCLAAFMHCVLRKDVLASAFVVEMPKGMRGISSSCIVNLCGRFRRRPLLLTNLTKRRTLPLSPFLPVRPRRPEDPAEVGKQTPGEAGLRQQAPQQEEPSRVEVGVAKAYTKRVVSHNIDSWHQKVRTGSRQFPSVLAPVPSLRCPARRVCGRVMQERDYRLAVHGERPELGMPRAQRLHGFFHLRCRFEVTR